MTNQAGTLGQPRSSGVRASLRRPWIPASLLALTVIGYTLLVFTFLRPHNAIANLDFWYHIELGRRLDMAQPATLTDGLYPLGYPAILRFAVQNHVDALRVGQALSWLGGLLSLVGLFGLSYRITREPFLALGGAVLLITNLRFLSTAGYEGNDLLAGGLQVIALWLAWEIADHAEWRACFSFAFAAGVVAGLAYLVRYTALIMLPILFLLAILQRRGLWRRGLVLGGVLLAAFLLTTLVQTIPSTLVHGDPFYNTQAKNVWFGIYGQRDWVNNWGKVLDSISLGEVLALGPRAFVTHWWREFLRFFWEMPLWTRFWHIAWITGGLFLLFYRRLPLVRRLLLLAALLAPTAVTAMASLDPRFLLVPLVMQALIIVLLLDGGLSLTPPRTRLAVYLVLAATFVACIQPSVRDALAWAQQPASDNAARVNRLLRAAGMTDPALVATNDPYLHAVDEPARTRYAQAYWVDSAPHSVAELLDQPAAKGWRYLVLNYGSGFGDYSAIREASAEQQQRLAPLSLEDAAAVYCVQPCADMAPDALTFDNGMELVGHSLLRSADGASVFLRWQTGAPLLESYKVSVRLIDATGNVVTQVDNVPQLWSRPTNTWKPGEVIEDFYRLESKEEVARAALVVYDAQSGQAVAARDKTGQRFGALINLGGG